MQNSDFPQIKRDLIDRIDRIEKFIKEESSSREETQKILRNINLRLNGDYMIYPPVKGHEQRIIDLEKVEINRIENKKLWQKTATGAVTIAVGGAMIWICDVLRDAFIKH